MALFGFRLGSPCLCVPLAGLWGLLPAASPGCCVVGPRQGTAGFWFVLKWANVSILAQAITLAIPIGQFAKVFLCLNLQNSLREFARKGSTKHNHCAGFATLPIYLVSVVAEPGVDPGEQKSLQNNVNSDAESGSGIDRGAATGSY